MISDEQIERMSHEVDDMLGDLGVKYGVSVLSLTGIVLARLALFNIHLGNRDDFNKLIHETLLPAVDEKEISLH